MWVLFFESDVWKVMSGGGVFGHPGCPLGRSRKIWKKQAATVDSLSSARGRGTRNPECLKQSGMPPGDMMMAKKIFGGGEDAIKNNLPVTDV